MKMIPWEEILQRTSPEVQRRAKERSRELMAEMLLVEIRLGPSSWSLLSPSRRCLAARESGVRPLVHLFQVRQRIRGQLVCVALSGGAEFVDISNDFLSGLRNSRGVQLAG